MKRFTFIGLFTIVFVFGILLNANAGMFVSKKIDSQEALATAEFWTPERMKAAKPYPIPEVEGNPVPYYQSQSQVTVADPGFSSSADSSKAKTESGDAFDDVSILINEDQKDALALAMAVEPMANGYDSYPPPYNTFPVWLALYGATPTRFSRFPYSAIGKVFFVQGGGSYVCSGSVQKGSAILTAGHCVSNGRGVWHRNWTFVPSYKKGKKPFGTFYARSLHTFTAWHTGGGNAFGRDVAYVIAKRRNGRQISRYTGYVGMSWNQNRYKLFNSFGYPAASPYTGKYLIQTQASTAKIDCSMSPCTTGIGTRQTGGSSGGPWLINYKILTYGSFNLANGVNSYVYTARPRVIYTPYFDSSVKSFWAWAIKQY